MPSAAGAPPTGASRAQRYAARAALLASTAGLGCSSSSAPAPGGQAGIALEAGNQEGSAAAGSQAGTTAGQQLMTAGIQAGAGAGLGAAGQGTSGSICPGFEETQTTQLSCRTTQDCPAGGLWRCQGQPPRTCSSPLFSLRQCDVQTVAADCGGTNFRCEASSCDSTYCVPTCSGEDCSPTHDCTDGRCVAKRCDEPGAAVCPINWECSPGFPLAGPRGCAPLACGEARPCRVNHDCVPGAMGGDANGCLRRRCTGDAECDCGYCVGGQCSESIGQCYQELAMPYGTVWPDAELV